MPDLTVRPTNALLALSHLIEWVGAEIAAEIDATYPAESHAAIVEWMRVQLSDLGGAG